MADVAEMRDSILVNKHQAWTPAGPVVSRLPTPEIDALEGRTMATVAEPSTLSLFGFATGTWMAAVVFGGFISPAVELPLAPVLILFAGLAQFIGGLYSFRRANVITANAFCCYGAYNTIVGTIILMEGAGFMSRTVGTPTILGWLNCTFAFISLAYAAASLSRNLVSVAVFGALMFGYALVGISQFFVQGLPGVAGAGGACLLVASFFAFYLGLAMVVNSAFRRTLLPLLGEA